MLLKRMIPRSWLIYQKAGKKLVSNGFIIQKNAKCKVQRYKTRLVVKDYKQRKGIDYGEVFTHIAWLDTTRLIISLAA
jgi:hypothetical protein